MKNILFLLILLSCVLTNAAVQTQLANKVIIGDASSTDKTLVFNAGAGVSNPSIRLNGTTNTLQTSVDGSFYKNLNVYSGIGETNILENAGFEYNGTNDSVYGWFASNLFPVPSTFVSATYVISESKSIRVNGSSGQYLYSSQYTIPKRMYGKQCVSKITYTTSAAGGAAKMYMEVYDGSGSVVAGGASYVTVATSTPKELRLNFVCPSSGTIGMRLTALGNTLYHYFDDAFLGEAATANSPQAPTIQRFTSGSGTYTTPINVKYIKVKIIGGGGGAAGSGTSGTAGAGGSGGTSTFGTSLLTVTGGEGGQVGAGGFFGGIGGTVTINTPAIEVMKVYGGIGSSGSGASTVSIVGGSGGNSCFGGGAGGRPAGASISGVLGSGGGGGGAGSASTVIGGSGGGAGGCAEAIINAPLSSYSYSVGSGGTSGLAGTSGFGGGAGGDGVIVVEEYY